MYFHPITVEPTDDVPDQNLITEHDRVLAWRSFRFFEMGVSLVEAPIFAILPIDLHDFARLRAHGCTVELAARILR